jgi:hypothetical protein
MTLQWTIDVTYDTGTTLRVAGIDDQHQLARALDRLMRNEEVIQITISRTERSPI